jgi:hypothetical protein
LGPQFPRRGATNLGGRFVVTESLLYRDKSGKELIVLTTEHSASSYGIPVMLVTSPGLPEGYAVYGPADTLETGLPVMKIIDMFLSGVELPEGQEWEELSEDALAACAAFVTLEFAEQRGSAA